MGNFFRGLVLLMLGFLVGLAATIMGALQTADEADPTFSDAPVFGSIMIASAGVMVLGPALFWIVAPIVSLVRRRRKEPT